MGMTMSKHRIGTWIVVSVLVALPTTAWSVSSTGNEQRDDRYRGRERRKFERDDIQRAAFSLHRKRPSPRTGKIPKSDFIPLASVNKFTGVFKTLVHHGFLTTAQVIHLGMIEQKTTPRASGISEDGFLHLPVKKKARTKKERITDKEDWTNVPEQDPDSVVTLMTLQTAGTILDVLRSVAEGIAPMKRQLSKHKVLETVVKPETDGPRLARVLSKVHKRLVTLPWVDAGGKVPKIIPAEERKEDVEGRYPSVDNPTQGPAAAGLFKVLRDAVGGLYHQFVLDPPPRATARPSG